MIYDYFVLKDPKSVYEYVQTPQPYFKVTLLQITTDEDINSQ